MRLEIVGIPPKNGQTRFYHRNRQDIGIIFHRSEIWHDSQESLVCSEEKIIFGNNDLGRLPMLKELINARSEIERREA